MAATKAAPQLHMYDDAHSLYASKARIALLHKKVAFTPLPVPCGSLSSPEYQRVVPLGKMPALLVTEPGHKQVVLMESEVIAEWLEERFPPPHHPPLLPTNTLLRAQARLISRFHDLYFTPTLSKLYPQVDPTKRDMAVVHATQGELQERLEQLEVLLQQADAVFADSEDASTNGSPSGSQAPQYAVGQALTMADCGFAPAFFYADLILRVLLGGGQGLIYTPRQQAWRRALFADPTVEVVMETLQPAALDWLHSKLGTAAR